MKNSKLAKILRARELRKEPTEAEKKLWPYLRDRTFFSIKFRRQHVFHGFILDFYCPENMLAIEVDGPIHAKQKEYDQARQTIIENYGLKVIRFKNREVMTDLKSVLKTIKEIVNPSPSQMEKGVKRKVKEKEKPGMRILNEN